MKPYLLVWGVLPALLACPAEPPPPQEVPRSAVVKAFSASPAEVQSGETATLSWEVEDANSVSIATLEGTAVPLPDAAASKGTVDVQVEKTTVYVLTARGEGGSDTAASSVLVRKKAGSVFCTVTPQEIEAGEPVTLVWNAAGATQIAVTDGAGAEIYSGSEVQGSKTITPSFSTTFTCAADSKSATVDLHVNPKVLGFTADASNVGAGGNVTLSWSVGGAESVSISAAGRGVLTTVDSPEQIADGSFTDTVPTDLPSHGLVTYTLEATVGQIQISRALEVYVGAEPRIVSFTVPEYAREAGIFNVEWTTSNADDLKVLVDGTPVYTAMNAADVAQGVVSLPSPAGTIEVELQVTNARGGKAIETRTIEPVGAPIVNSPVEITPSVIATGGEPATISWDITNARNVKVKNADGAVIAQITGLAAEVGSVVVYPNQATQYTVEVDNSVGDSILPSPTVSIDVTTPATLTYASPIFPEGGKVRVTGSTAVNSGQILGLPYLEKNVPGEAFVDISGDGTPINYPSGYTSTTRVANFGTSMDTLIYGVRGTHDSFAVNINGYMRFSTSTSSGSSDNTQPFPSTQLLPLAMAPYFDDLFAKDDGSSEIYWRVDGTGMDKRLIVQWENVEHEDHPGSALTFQVQVFASGKVVFAYETLQGLAGNVPNVGVINADETDAIYTTDVPAEGDTFTFFAPVTPPVEIEAFTDPYAVRVMVGTGAYVDILADPPEYLPLGELTITELNVNPAAGAVDGQWFEVVNNTAADYDLTGWELDFGGSTYPLPSLTIPANGTVVFGQSSAAADGYTLTHEYGNGFSIPMGGAISLNLGGQPYAAMQLPPATLPVGYSWHTGPISTEMTAAAGASTLECSASSTTPYGTTVVQYGTPGTANTACPNYSYTGAITGAFEAIATVGTEITFTNEDDGFAVIQLQNPIILDRAAFSAVAVSTNGYISLDPNFDCYREDQYCYSSNKSSLDLTEGPYGVLAPFWDDIDTTGASSGVFIHYVPESAPGANDGHTIISWENVYQFDQPTDALNFQAKFFDNGNIEYHYGLMVGSSGESATVWFEHPTGKAAFVVSVDTTGSVLPNTAVQLAAQ